MGSENAFIELIRLAHLKRALEVYRSSTSPPAGTRAHGILAELDVQLQLDEGNLLFKLGEQFVSKDVPMRSPNPLSKRASHLALCAEEFYGICTKIVGWLASLLVEIPRNSTGSSNSAAWLLHGLCCEVLPSHTDAVLDELNTFASRVEEVRQKVAETAQESYGCAPPRNWMVFLLDAFSNTEKAEPKEGRGGIAITSVPSFQLWEAQLRQHIQRISELTFAVQRDVVSVLNSITTTSNFPLLAPKKQTASPMWLQFVEMIEEAFYWQAKNSVLFTLWAFHELFKGSEGLCTRPLFSVSMMWNEKTRTAQLNLTSLKISDRLFSIFRNDVIRSMVPEFNLGRMTKVLADRTSGNASGNLKSLPREDLERDPSLKKLMDDLLYMIGKRCKQMNAEVERVEERCTAMMQTEKDYHSIRAALYRARSHFGGVEEIVAQGLVTFSLESFQQSLVRALTEQLHAAREEQLRLLASSSLLEEQSPISSSRWENLFFATDEKPAEQELTSLLQQHRFKERSRYDSGLNPTAHVTRLLEEQQKDAYVPKLPKTPNLLLADATLMRMPIVSGRSEGGTRGDNRRPTSNSAAAPLTDVGSTRRKAQGPVVQEVASKVSPLASGRSAASAPKGEVRSTSDTQTPRPSDSSPKTKVTKSGRSNASEPMESERTELQPRSKELCSSPRQSVTAGQRAVLNRRLKEIRATYPFLPDEPCPGVYLSDVDFMEDPRFRATLNQLLVKKSTVSIQGGGSALQQEMNVIAVVKSLALEAQQQTLAAYRAMPYLQIRVHGVLLGLLSPKLDDDDEFQSLKRLRAQVIRGASSTADGNRQRLQNVEKCLCDRASTLASTIDFFVEGKGLREASESALKAIALKSMPVATTAPQPTPVHSPRDAVNKDVWASATPTTVNPTGQGTEIQGPDAKPTASHVDGKSPLSEQRHASRPPRWISSAPHSHVTGRESSAENCAQLSGHRQRDKRSGAPESHKLTPRPCTQHRQERSWLQQCGATRLASGSDAVRTDVVEKREKRSDALMKSTGSAPLSGKADSSPFHRDGALQKPIKQSPYSPRDSGNNLSQSILSFSHHHPGESLEQRVSDGNTADAKVLSPSPKSAKVAPSPVAVEHAEKKPPLSLKILDQASFTAYSQGARANRKGDTAERSLQEAMDSKQGTPRLESLDSDLEELLEKQRELEQQRKNREERIKKMAARLTVRGQRRLSERMDELPASLEKKEVWKFSVPPEEADSRANDKASTVCSAPEGPNTLTGKSTRSAMGSGTSKSTMNSQARGLGTSHYSCSSSPKLCVLSKPCLLSSVAADSEGKPAPQSAVPSPSQDAVKGEAVAPKGPSHQPSDSTHKGAESFILRSEPNQSDATTSQAKAEEGKRRLPQTGHPKQPEAGRCSPLGLNTWLRKEAGKSNYAFPRRNVEITSSGSPSHPSTPATANVYSRSGVRGTSTGAETPTNSGFHQGASQPLSPTANRSPQRMRGGGDDGASQGSSATPRRNYLALYESQAKYDAQLGMRTSQGGILDMIRESRSRSNGESPPRSRSPYAAGGTVGTVFSQTLGQPLRTPARPRIQFSDNISLSEVYLRACQELNMRANSGLLRTFPGTPGSFLQRLDLSVNYVGAKGLRSILYVLERNGDRLQFLSLSNNNLENLEVVELADVLSKRPGSNLVELDLSYNPVSQAGGQAIHQLVSACPRLTTVKLKGTLIPPKLLQTITDAMEGRVCR